ncbi:PCNA protein, partial [Atractosteus spatula]|nr:PCNA protein [Atractosteus spatula]
MPASARSLGLFQGDLPARDLNGVWPRRLGVGCGSVLLESGEVVEYKIADMGHVKYYLAPKIDEESS